MQVTHFCFKGIPLTFIRTKIFKSINNSSSNFMIKASCQRNHTLIKTNIKKIARIGEINTNKTGYPISKSIIKEIKMKRIKKAIKPKTYKLGRSYKILVSYLGTRI